MNTKIFVMTHKVFDVPNNDTYVPLQVGAAINKNLGYLRDDDGDNISDLNPYFGELTGYYWIWKNCTDTDIVGVCHYRRFFGIDGRLMEASEFESILDEYDVITSNLVETEMPTYREEFGNAHNINDLILVGDGIKNLYPEYYASFEKALESNKTCYGNLCVMKKTLFDEYCDWMFSIFTWMMDKVDFTGYDAYHKRLFGFLSENLLSVFIDAKGLKSKEGTIYITDEKAETKELKLALSQLVKEEQFTEARNMFYNFIKIRPDVLLPLSDISGELMDINLILGILESEKMMGIDSFHKMAPSLKELIPLYRRIRQILSEQKAGNVINSNDQKFLDDCNVSEIAREIISIN